jgi:hypothetical protein
MLAIKANIDFKMNNKEIICQNNVRLIGTPQNPHSKFHNAACRAELCTQN